VTALRRCGTTRSGECQRCGAGAGVVRQALPWRAARCRIGRVWTCAPDAARIGRL